MKVKILNRTKFTQYVDLDGSGNVDLTVVVGPSASAFVEVGSESQFLKLSKQFKDILVLRKQ